MNLLDLPLPVVLAGWLLRRISSTPAKIIRQNPGITLELERELVGKIEGGLDLHEPSRLQRLCLDVLTRFLASEEQAYRKLLHFDVWYTKD